MKKVSLLVVIICVLLSVTFGQKSKNNIYDLSEGKTYLTHFQQKVKEQQVFSFLATKGTMYEILIISENPAVIECEGLEITLTGTENKSFNLTGNGKLINLTVQVEQKTDVTIGIYFVPKNK